MNRLFTISIAVFLLSTASLAQTKPMDYLHVPGPIVFDGKSYLLNWSAHPSANFYKQEYIQKGELADKYKTMILLDVITGQSNIKEVVSAKIAELKELKKNNPVINYEIMDNPKSGEYILDFLLTASTPDGKDISIVERNVYRYKLITDKSGQKGILLFGVSTRGYNAEVDKFFAGLKSNRKNLISSVAKFAIPEISLK